MAALQRGLALLKDANDTFENDSELVDLFADSMIVMFLKMPAHLLKNYLDDRANGKPGPKDHLGEIIGLLRKKLEEHKHTFDRVKNFPESSAAETLREKVGALNTLVHKLCDTLKDYGASVEELNALANDTENFSNTVGAKSPDKNLDNTAKNTEKPPHI